MIPAWLKSIEAWRQSSPSHQIDWWVGVPVDQVPAFLDACHPAARTVLECAPRMTGDRGADRATILKAIMAGDWANVGLDLAEIRDDENLLNRFIDLQVQQRQGRAQWQDSVEPTVLDQWPAARLVAIGSRLKSGIKQRWVQAGGHLFSGRMIALKTDAVWSEFSSFGWPHPPYDPYLLDLDVIDIDRSEASRLKIT